MEELFGATEGAAEALMGSFRGSEQAPPQQASAIFEQLNEQDIDALLHHYGPEALERYLGQAGG
jgi:hypothetical protein